MNAKKIMGAVLVALLAAALFVGAGAAEGNNYGPVFTYQSVTGIPQGVWESGDASVEITTGNYVIPGDNFVSGAVYKKGDDTLTVYYPTVAYSANGQVNSIGYLVKNNGIAYNGSTTFTVTATPLNGTTGDWDINFQTTYPNGSVITAENPFQAVPLSQKGVYKMQAVFNKSQFMGGNVPFDLMLDSKVFTFTVVGEEDATITADKNTAYNGEAVTLSISGTPGAKYNLSIKGLDLNNGLYPFKKETDGTVSFTLENNGKAVFTGLVNKTTAEEQKTVIIKLLDDNKPVDNGELKIKIAAPVVTAKVEKDTYYLGDMVKILGTATSNAELNFSIKGTNFDLTYVELDGYVAGKTWEGELDTAELQDDAGKLLDVGIYSIIIKQGGDEVATLPVNLIQPFIQLTDAPEVVVQGTKATFVGTAEATNQVYYYVFGTNFFDAELVDSTKFDENEFTFEIPAAKTNNMSAGQYFVVVQHPMYNGVFNIAPNYTAGKLDGGIMLNTTGSALVDGSELFNVYDRQTANAAQALCDALDSQNIDDMYVKYAFIVAGKDQAFSINEIPSEIAQGETLTISGTATASEGKYVTVELISTAFAAVPKETVGSASFIALSTQVAEDGTWEVTFDTSNINVDEYSLKVACGDDTWKSTTINVVEGAETPDTPDTPDVPDTPDTPDTPTEPTTPGFGALAALAGLGAVAVLLLRRE